MDDLSIINRALVEEVKELEYRIREMKRARKNRESDREWQRCKRISLSMSVEEAQSVEVFLRSAAIRGVVAAGEVKNFGAKLRKYLSKRKIYNEQAVLREQEKDQHRCAPGPDDGRDCQPT